MPSLHIYCDFREPSLSRAVHEVRRLDRYALLINKGRSANLADNLESLAAAMGEDDLALVALLHAQEEQLELARLKVLRYPLDVRSRITLSFSRYAPALRGWAESCGFKCEENDYEVPRHSSSSPSDAAKVTTCQERQWIQYRLMRALIAGESTPAVFEEILGKLRGGGLSELELRRGVRFHEQGEPDMAGGNYAEERRINPNAIDLLRNRALQVGRSGLNTLIIGETGTGKESLAWYLHDFSTRCDSPFLALNCAFFEGERLESELFGHEQGAFTDAKKAKRGLVEEAAGGTLFLDELPEMAPRVQAKLLRFLQDGSYTRLGGNVAQRASVRIIAAAQPGLLGKLRDDLYYRVADVELRAVPLREMKPRDIVNIACNLAYRLMWRPIINEKGEGILTPDLIREIWLLLSEPQHAESFAGYAWPGNMRELSTMIKRLVLLGDDIFAELRGKLVCSVGAAEQSGAFDDEWRQFLLPVATLEELEMRQLKLRNLQPAFVRHLVAGLGGRDQIQPTKLAEMLGCSYNTLVAALGKESPRISGSEQHARDGGVEKIGKRRGEHAAQSQPGNVRPA
jgi:DNA-binding NtrC family response regulator